MKYRARKAYQKKEAVEAYDKKRFATLEGRLTNKREKYLIDKALRYAGINPPAIILDIPCGTGRLSTHLAQKGFKVKSADLSQEMVVYTRRKLKALNLANRVIVEVGDAECLSYPDNSFDACISLRLFGHTPPKIREKILEELKRVVKKYLIVVYYHKDCLRYFLRRRWREKQGIEWYPVGFKQMKKELADVGLKRIKSFFLAKGISETVVVLVQK